MNLEFFNSADIKLENADTVSYSKYITFEEELKEDINFEEEILLRATPTSFTAYDDLMLDDPRMCSKCDKVFPNSFTFLQHNIDHIEVPLTKLNIHTCKKCNQTFQSKRHLDEHRSTHKLTTLDELQTCNICNKTFTRKRWTAHIDEVHGMLRHECQLCKKVVKTLSTLKNHMMFVHEKKYKPWRFRTHDTGEEYRCKKCPKIFKHKYSLQTHVKNCHSDVEYECGICKKMFTSKPYLNTHLQRVHCADGKEYACEICGKLFKSTRRVSIHKKNSHKNFKS
ncbi:unnamed protein product [Colias eurytheme]|nr:unnamed protein product [Colias eurytheme]